MSDVVLVWVLAAPLGVGVIALLGLCCVQVLKRYAGRPVPQILWAAAIILYPFAGVAAWAVWDTWGRTMLSRSRGNTRLRLGRSTFEVSLAR